MASQKKAVKPLEMKFRVACCDDHEEPNLGPYRVFNAAASRDTLVLMLVGYPAMLKLRHTAATLEEALRALRLAENVEITFVDGRDLVLTVKQPS